MDIASFQTEMNQIFQEIGWELSLSKGKSTFRLELKAPGYKVINHITYPFCFDENDVRGMLIKEIGGASVKINEQIQNELKVGKLFVFAGGEIFEFYISSIDETGVTVANPKDVHSYNLLSSPFYFSFREKEKVIPYQRWEFRRCLN